MANTRIFDWKDRLRASGIHLGVSLLIATFAALLVFALWYPYPYRDSSGGRELFLIVITVDVILGPLITLAVFSRNKPRQELVRDLAIVGLIQLTALMYGLWTLYVARPVHVVFEVDRFRVIHAIEIPEELLDLAPPTVRKLPLTGPTPLAVRPFKDAREESDATIAALGGVSLSARPDLWQNYPEARHRVLAASRPFNELRQRFPQQTAEIDAVVTGLGVPNETLRYLPMVARNTFWTVLLDAKTAEIRGFVPLDSF